MASVTICGQEYPLAYTIDAQSKIAALCGGLSKIESLLVAEDAADALDGIAHCVAIMIRAYEDRETVRSKLMGNKRTEKYVPEYSEIVQALEPKEVYQLMQAVADAFREGGKITTEVEPDKTKNADATP